MDAASSLPPGPPIRRGVVRSLRYYAAFARDPIAFVRGRFETYGDSYYAPNTKGAVFVSRDPDHIHEVLATKASSFTKQHTAFEQLSRVLGDGLLTSDGETWKRQRRMMMPAFAPARIAGYGAVMVEEALETAQIWERDPGVRAVGEDMTALTLRVVSRALFGHDVRASDIATIAGSMATFQRSLSSPDFLPKWMPLPARARLERAAGELDRLMLGLIAARRSSKPETRAGRTDPTLSLASLARTDPTLSLASLARTDLLEMLLTAVDAEGTGGQLSVEEVRDQLVTLFLAGHETTAHTLSWTFYCLARSPDVEQKLHDELDSVLDGRAPTVSDLERLPYTDQVVSEALRMYPPVYAVARRAAADVTIGDWTVPLGTEVALWVYLMHHDPKLFPEPETFRPERFAPDRVAAIPKFAYLPFGGGPRACIGKSFAMMEARLLLATLAQRWRLTLAPGHRVEIAPRITLTPKRGLSMVVSPRAPKNQKS